MNNEEIKKYIEDLKKLERDILDDDTDINFISDLNNLLGKLDEDIKTDMFSQKGMVIKFKKISPDAISPSYSKEGDAGMDLTITSVISESEFDISYGFGIAVEIPKGFVGLIFPRSSVRKYDLSLTNCVGVIDSGYRGELQATFKKTHSGHKKYMVGDRAAQIIIIAYPQIDFVESDKLNETDRGTGGFGSTGK